MARFAAMLAILVVLVGSVWRLQGPGGKLSTAHAVSSIAAAACIVAPIGSLVFLIFKKRRYDLQQFFFLCGVVCSAAAIGRLRIAIFGSLFSGPPPDPSKADVIYGAQSADVLMLVGLSIVVLPTLIAGWLHPLLHSRGKFERR